MSYRIHLTRKRPDEEFVIEADFSNLLATGETINTFTITATDKDGSSVSTTFLDQSTKTLDSDSTGIQIQLRAGTDALSPYKVLFQAISTSDNTFEIVVYVNVRT